MIEPITVRKTLPKTTKKAIPMMIGTTVAAEPNIEVAAPLARRRRTYSRTALRSTGSTRGRASNGTDAAGPLTPSVGSMTHTLPRLASVDGEFRSLPSWPRMPNSG
jgi:hypothetical protein